MWSFVAGAGTATFTVDVMASWGSMIRANDDLLVTLRNPSGNTMTTANPAGITAPVGLGVGSTTVTLPSAGA
jgi:hypothetical protein